MSNKRSRTRNAVTRVFFLIIEKGGTEYTNNLHNLAGVSSVIPLLPYKSPVCLLHSLSGALCCLGLYFIEFPIKDKDSLLV
ncbi:hypothetical protein CLU79DRAFT_773140 [Phycomyces nitens]|nr:hypothetical protein CLU79DRAFT_773140 [Phycomyces nitens]